MVRVEYSIHNKHNGKIAYEIIQYNGEPSIQEVADDLRWFIGFYDMLIYSKVEIRFLES